MPTYVFPEITARVERTGNCPECLKRVKRSRAFTNTVSPFNKHPDGTVRTAAEVREKVNAEAAAWRPSPRDLLHQRCYDDLADEQVAAYDALHREAVVAR